MGRPHGPSLVTALAGKLCLDHALRNCTEAIITCLKCWLFLGLRLLNYALCNPTFCCPSSLRRLASAVSLKAESKSTEASSSSTSIRSDGLRPLPTGSRRPCPGGPMLLKFRGEDLMLTASLLCCSSISLSLSLPYLLLCICPSLTPLSLSAAAVLVVSFTLVVFCSTAFSSSLTLSISPQNPKHYTPRPCKLI